MDWSVTAWEFALVATIMAIRTDLRLGLAESGERADVYEGEPSVVDREGRVENKPRHISGHTVKR